MKNSVRAGAHRLEDERRILSVGDGENARGRGRGAQRLDGRHAAGAEAARIDDDDVGRRPPRGARSSVTPIGTAPERSCWPIAFLNASSSLTMRPVNCAMRPL